jgi:hypothetical protein
MPRRIYYLPTFLRDNPPKEGCTLFVRIYERKRTKTGKYRTTIKRDVFVYDNEVALADAINGQGMKELPAEAESDQRYIPPSLRSSQVRLA